MDWSLPETHIFGGSYYLRDNQSGEVIKLREGASYRFEIEQRQTFKVPKPWRFQAVMPLIR
ncbi:MAG: hypothetical protein R3220_03795 [Balneolaceae bacterium]|nr:hypothetical protein [Balneolaceae bacterium]